MKILLKKFYHLLNLLIISLWLPFGYSQVILKPMQNIQNINSALAQIKLTTIPIAIPQFFPTAKNKTYYAYVEANKLSYYLYIDYTNNCHGAHYCNAGQMIGQKDGELISYRDNHGNRVTVRILLKNNVQGYYTPGLNLGTYHLPRLAWQSNHVVYTLLWNADQKTLIKMANSTIKPI